MMLDDEGNRLPDFLHCGQPRYRCAYHPECQFDTYNLADLVAHEKSTHEASAFMPGMSSVLFDFSGSPITPTSSRIVNTEFMERDKK